MGRRLSGRGRIVEFHDGSFNALSVVERMRTLLSHMITNDDVWKLFNEIESAGTIEMNAA